MQFELVDNVGGFMSLADEWEKLESRIGCHIFQTHRFLASWLGTAAHFDGMRPAVVLYREAGMLRGILPACSFKRLMIPFLTWMGGRQIVDYGDILYDVSAELALGEFLEKGFSILRERLGFHFYFLHNVRNDATVFQYLRRHFTPCRTDVAPYIQLSGDIQTRFDSLKKLSKMPLRRIKRMQEAGAVEFRVIDGTSPFGREVLKTLIQLKQSRHGALWGQGYEKFYFTEAALNRNSHLSALLLDGKIVAAHFGYLYKNRLYWLIPTFDLRFTAFSPGRVLSYFLLKECVNQGVEIFDFCIGAEPYKYEWTRDEVELTTFAGGDLSGKAFAALMPWLRGARRLFRGIRNSPFRAAGTGRGSAA